MSAFEMLQQRQYTPFGAPWERYVSRNWTAREILAVAVITGAVNASLDQTPKMLAEFAFQVADALIERGEKEESMNKTCWNVGGGGGKRVNDECAISLDRRIEEWLWEGEPVYGIWGHVDLPSFIRAALRKRLEAPDEPMEASHIWVTRNNESYLSPGWQECSKEALNAQPLTLEII